MDSAEFGIGGYTYRTVMGSALSLSGPSLGHVRLTIAAWSSTDTILDHVGLGVSNGTQSDTLATPVEITFGGGGHGCTITAGNVAVSDWISFACLQTDKLVAIFDLNSGSGTFTARDTTTNEGVSYYHASAASYNSASTLPDRHQKVFGWPSQRLKPSRDSEPSGKTAVSLITISTAASTRSM
jgi:hypothetical protein